MTNSNNPYDILGINKDATPEQVKAAWKKQAYRQHPDHGGTVEGFVRVKQAAMVLLDPQKRRRFNEEGVAEGSEPDNIYSQAIEKIAQFFINSIDATVDHPTGIRDMDFVEGCKAFFDKDIQQSQQNVVQVTRRLTNYEKVLKRIKSKKSDNTINTMINVHMGHLRQTVDAHNRQIVVAQRAKEVLNDYTFDVEAGIFSTPWSPR